MKRNCHSAGRAWSCFLALLLGLPASAQPAAVGVVTSLQGRVDLTRPSAPAPVALRFRDDLFLRDIIEARENSSARMLFGGQSTVTVRELTRLEVRTEILPTGATRTVHDLAEGKIRVAVAPKLMGPGDRVVIRTRNVVSEFRMTVVIAEYNPKTNRSLFVPVEGCAGLVPQGGVPLTLCKNERVAITGSTVGPVETVSPEEVAQLQAEFALEPPHRDEANRVQILETHDRTSVELMEVIVKTVTDQGLSSPPETGTGDLLRRTNVDRTPVDASLPVPLITNGGFEGGGVDPSGNFILGWTVLNQEGGSGGFFKNFGASAPLDFCCRPPLNAPPLMGFTVPLPPGGSAVAMSDQLGPGSHILFQDFAVPDNGVLRFDLFIGNRAGDFVSPNSITLPNFNVILLGDASANQQARVDIMDPAAPNFDVGAGVIQNLFQTNPGDPLVSGYNTFVFDISALAGQNVRLRFAEVDNVLEFQLGVDNVSLTDPAGDLVLKGSGNRTVSEPFLRLGTTVNIGTDPAAAADLLDIRDGARLVMNSADPVVLLDGATITVGTTDTTPNDSPNRLFNLQGVNTDPATGLGTDQPIIGSGIDPPPFSGATKPIGVLLEATDGTTVAVQKGVGDTAGGNALYLDTALLEASAPIIHLIGSATGQTSLKTDGSTMDLFKSTVTALGPVVALDSGLITVQNGPLMRLTDGSNMIVTGDLLSLINGSRINVLNGPLASVDEAGSRLSVSGALVNFGGTGGNSIVVNNNIVPTATLSGLPVSATTGGSISIGPNPVKNPDKGSISVTGTLIQATNGGAVNIAAP